MPGSQSVSVRGRKAGGALEISLMPSSFKRLQRLQQAAVMW